MRFDLAKKWDIRKASTTSIVVLLSFLLGASIALDSSMTMFHPIIMTLGVFLFLGILISPTVGVQALVFLLWFTPLFSFTGGLTLNRMVGIVVLGSLVLRKIINKTDRSINITSFDKIFYLFVVWVSAGLIFEGVTDNTYTQFLGMFMGYLLYFLITNTLQDWNGVRRLTYVLLGSGMIIAISAFQAYFQTGNLETKGNLGIQFVNTLAEFSYIAIILLLWLIEELSIKNRLLIYVLIAGFITTIFMAGNRSILLSIIFSILLLGILYRRSSRQVSVFTLVLLLIVIGQIALMSFPNISSSILDVNFVNYFFGTGNSANISTPNRVMISRVTVQAFIGNPVWGVGFGNLRVYYKVVEHNIFLATLAETGLIGLTMVLTLYGYLIYKIWQTRQRARLPRHITALNYVLVLVLGHTVINPLFHGQYLERPTFVTFALAMVVIQLINKELNNEAANLVPIRVKEENSNIYDT